jgi:hypothetical protein
MRYALAASSFTYQRAVQSWRDSRNLNTGTRM